MRDFTNIFGNLAINRWPWSPFSRPNRSWPNPANEWSNPNRPIHNMELNIFIFIFNIFTICSL